MLSAVFVRASVRHYLTLGCEDHDLIPVALGFGDLGLSKIVSKERWSLAEESALETNWFVLAEVLGPVPLNPPEQNSTNFPVQIHPLDVGFAHSVDIRTRRVVVTSKSSHDKSAVLAVTPSVLDTIVSQKNSNTSLCLNANETLTTLWKEKGPSRRYHGECGDVCEVRCCGHCVDRRHRTVATGPIQDLVRRPPPEVRF